MTRKTYTADQMSDKLDKLFYDWGIDYDDMLLYALGVHPDGSWGCPAICMNEGCDYTTDMEPDQDQGWCEVCGTNTVASAAILAGVI